MLNAQTLHNAWREHAARKRAPKDGIKLLVKTTDAQALKVQGFGLEQLRRRKTLLAHDLDVVVVCVMVSLWDGSSSR